MDLGSIELHDALLKKLEIDYVRNAAVVGIEFYESPDASSRKSALITFDGVRSISKICDLERMQKNARAGNINYWAPTRGKGTTYIYLVDGCMAITAQAVRFDIQSSEKPPGLG